MNIEIDINKLLVALALSETKIEGLDKVDLDRLWSVSVTTGWIEEKNSHGPKSITLKFDQS